MEAVRYRVEQFWRAVTARYSMPQPRIERATGGLPPEARALFARQAPQDQRHALAVYETLCQEGHTDPGLLAAALLHDVGKASARLPAWKRAVLVLAERFAPTVLNRAVRDRHGGRWFPLTDYAAHPEMGAQWAEKAGCSPLTVTLIRRHEEKLETCKTEEDCLLARLQAADCAN